jgi:hypothetical protein
MKNTFKFVVAGKDQNDDSDFYFVKVSCTDSNKDKAKRGARYAASNNGYYGHVVFDETFSGWSELEEMFVWESASTVDINGEEIEIKA